VNLTVEKAALRKDGVVYTLPRPARHSDVIGDMSSRGIQAYGPGVEQGFVLSDGRFVGRQYAAEVATEAGQILPGRVVRARTLTSEEVW
jgi:hypothetical protein